MKTLVGRCLLGLQTNCKNVAVSCYPAGFVGRMIISMTVWWMDPSANHQVQLWACICWFRKEIFYRRCSVVCGVPTLSLQPRRIVTHWIFAGLSRPCFVCRGISDNLGQSTCCVCPWIPIITSEIHFQKKRKKRVSSLKETLPQLVK